MKNVKELNKIADSALADARKTVEAVVDPQSFVESDRFIRSETALGDAVGEGVTCGFATVNDVQICIFAISGAVLKGGIGKANAAKIVKCVNNAVATSSPLVGIVDTCGARFAEGIEAMEGYGEILAAFAAAYGNVPTVLVEKGSNFGLLSYLSSVVDFTVVCEKAVVATSSPLILAAAAGADTAKVGTAAVMDKAGLASLVVKDDAELAKVIATIVSATTELVVDTGDDENRAAELNADSPVDRVIAETFDAGTFLELKKGSGAAVKTGLARLGGVSVGVVAFDGNENEGRLTPCAAEKITDLVNTCDNLGLPIVDIVDSKGAMNCLECQGRLMRFVGDMIYAYNASSVAKISLVKGNAIGLGYVGFASKSTFDYTVAWENACIGLLDNEQSASLVYSAEIAAAPDREKATAKLAAAYGEENTSAVTVAEKGFIDNVIQPKHTRRYLIAAVRAFIGKR